MALDPAAARVLEAYQFQNDDLARRVAAYVAANWNALGSHRDADIARFVAAVAPVLDGAQLRMADLTVTYLRQLDRILFGGAGEAVAVADVSTVALRGVTTAEALTRAGTQVYYDLSRGRTYDQAAKAGLNRAQSIASTNLQLAKTHTTRTAFEADDRVVGYRRVLKGAYDCAKCVVASTQRYRKARLMPIHPGCNCDVMEIRGDRDPGQVIDPDRLADIHQRIAEEFGELSEGARGIPGSVREYRDVLVTHEHGEIGPVLGVRGQTFTGPADI